MAIFFFAEQSIMIAPSTLNHAILLMIIIRTRNFLIHYDLNFNVLSQKEIIENFPREYDQSRIKGLEDCRLFTFNDQFWFMCATFGTHHNTIGQTLCKLADDFSDNKR